MKYAKFIYFVLLILIVLGYNNCGRSLDIGKLLSVNGTEIGNPKPEVGQPQGAEQIRWTVCGLLVRCHSGLTQQQCEQDFENLNGVGEALGLPAGSYDPFSRLREAETQRLVLLNEVNLRDCLSGIDQKSCNEASVVAAYDAGLSPAIRNAAGVLTDIAACSNVFREP